MDGIIRCTALFLPFFNTLPTLLLCLTLLSPSASPYYPSPPFPTTHLRLPLLSISKSLYFTPPIPPTLRLSLLFSSASLYSPPLLALLLHLPHTLLLHLTLLPLSVSPYSPSLLYPTLPFRPNLLYHYTSLYSTIPPTPLYHYTSLYSTLPPRSPLLLRLDLFYYTKTFSTSFLLKKLITA